MPAGKLGLSFSDGTEGVRIDEVQYGSPLRLPSGSLMVEVGWQLMAIDGEPVKGFQQAAEHLKAAADRKRTLTLAVPRVPYGQLLAFFSTLVATVAVLYAVASTGVLPVVVRIFATGSPKAKEPATSLFKRCGICDTM